MKSLIIIYIYVQLFGFYKLIYFLTSNIFFYCDISEYLFSGLELIANLVKNKRTLTEDWVFWGKNSLYMFFISTFILLGILTDLDFSVYLLFLWLVSALHFFSSILELSLLWFFWFSKVTILCFSKNHNFSVLLYYKSHLLLPCWHHSIRLVKKQKGEKTTVKMLAVKAKGKEQWFHDKDTYKMTHYMYAHTHTNTHTHKYTFTYFSSSHLMYQKCMKCSQLQYSRSIL